MQPIAAALSERELPELVAYYAGLPGLSDGEVAARSGDADAAIERGRAIAQRGVPNQRVGSCVDCHGPAPKRKNANYPRLAGQYVDYLVLQLELFDRSQRGGSSYAHLMHKVAPRLSPHQMRDVAAYYASLAPTPPGEE
jgi:cytochrome c553